MQYFLNKIRLIIATGCGGGFLPIAPGSWGSAMVAVVCWWLVTVPVLWYCVWIVGIFFIGSWAVQFADPYYTRLTGKAHDNKTIVIDEWVGQSITYIPLLYFGRSFIIIAIGFFLFRAFDTAKFGLAGYFDRHPSYWGVLLDDVIAGVYAAVVFSLVLWIAQHTDFLQFVF